VPQNTVAGPQKILQGYKVVELATVVAGPTAAAMLADLGASVIKVENPDRPDEVRGYDGETAATAKPGGLFQQYNRGKRGITLNIQKPGGIAVLKQLLADADVFVTNVRLHSLKKLGLDYDSLKNEFPQLVYGQLSAWGLQGEKAKDPGYDFGAFWAYSGVMEAIRSSGN
jgi:crotonobetainyl-CoA:carnitine CoA-transferase CaiB-like acyl-CoA transferase